MLTAHAHIVKPFPTSGRGSLFERYCRYKIPRGTPSVGRYTRRRKNLRFYTRIVIYLGNGTRWPMVTVTNKKSYVTDRPVSVPMTLIDLERRDARNYIFPASPKFLKPQPTPKRFDLERPSMKGNIRGVDASVSHASMPRGGAPASPENFF